MYRKLEPTFGLILATLFLVGNRHMTAAFPAVQLSNVAVIPPPTPPDQASSPDETLEDEVTSRHNAIVATTVVTQWARRDGTPGQATALEAGPAIVSAPNPWEAVTVILEAITSPTPILKFSKREPRRTGTFVNVEVVNGLIMERATAAGPTPTVDATLAATPYQDIQPSVGIVPNAVVTEVVTNLAAQDANRAIFSYERRDEKGINDTPLKRDTAITALTNDAQAVDTTIEQGDKGHKGSRHWTRASTPTALVSSALVDDESTIDSWRRDSQTFGGVLRKSAAHGVDAPLGDEDGEGSVQWKRRAVAVQNIAPESIPDTTNIWGPLDVNATDIGAALEQMGGSSDDDSTVAKEKRGGGRARNGEGDAVSAEPLKPLKERATAFQ